MTFTPYPPRDLLAALRALGVTLEARGGKLFASPVAPLTDALRAGIKEHREALLEELFYEREDVQEALADWAWEHPDSPGLHAITLVEGADGRLRWVEDGTLADLGLHNAMAHERALATREGHTNGKAPKAKKGKKAPAAGGLFPGGTP